jgi:drug/metabolite transporter (DMT)-like permease
MNNNKINFKIISLIILIDLLESTYEFFFKKGMLMVGEFNFSTLSIMSDYAARVLSNGWIWMGFAIIIIETLMWFAVLSKIDLSVAFPVASSSYIFILLISIFFLHEDVGLNRLVGTVLIILGIYLVARSSEDKSPED